MKNWREKVELEDERESQKMDGVKQKESKWQTGLSKWSEK